LQIKISRKKATGYCIRKPLVSIKNGEGKTSGRSLDDKGRKKRKRDKPACKLAKGHSKTHSIGSKSERRAKNRGRRGGRGVMGGVKLQTGKSKIIGCRSRVYQREQSLRCNKKKKKSRGREKKKGTNARLQSLARKRRKNAGNPP